MGEMNGETICCRTLLPVIRTVSLLGIFSWNKLKVNSKILGTPSLKFGSPLTCLFPKLSAVFDNISWLWCFTDSVLKTLPCAVLMWSHHWNSSPILIHLLHSCSSLVCFETGHSPLSEVSLNIVPSSVQ